jgi:hypothetical protein
MKFEDFVRRPLIRKLLHDLNPFDEIDRVMVQYYARIPQGSASREIVDMVKLGILKESGSKKTHNLDSLRLSPFLNDAESFDAAGEKRVRSKKTTKTYTRDGKWREALLKGKK